MIKYSRTLGKLTVVNETETIITVVVDKTGETKKLLKSAAFLQDEPFIVEKKEKAKTIEISAEDKARLELMQQEGFTQKILNKSTRNYRAGKSGLSSL